MKLRRRLGRLFRDGRDRGTGIAYIDVEWIRRRELELSGMTSEPEVSAHWEPADAESAADCESKDFRDPEAAIKWARDRAPIVLVRLGPEEEDIYSAGTRRATRELAEYGGTDLTEYPLWPPEGRA